MTASAHLTPALFDFLAELRENNDRDWFTANKARYERDVKEPLQGFIAAFSGPLSEISEHLVADPRRSMFRIHRDVRFGKDKSPYKTHAAAQFRHEAGKDVHAPGLYLHLAPGEVFAGAGMWHPDGKSLAKIRDRIVDQPARWRAARDEAGFAARWRLTGDVLKRAPRGYDADHPLVEDLKRKDFIAITDLDEAAVCAPDFVARFAELCASATPLMRFLTRAVEVAW